MVVFPSSQTSLASKKLTCSLHSIFSCNSSKSDDCVEYLLDLLSSSTLFNLRSAVTISKHWGRVMSERSLFNKSLLKSPSLLRTSLTTFSTIGFLTSSSEDKFQIIQMPTFQSVGKTRNAKTLFVQMTANTGIHERRKLKQLQQTRMLQESRVLLLNLQYISLLIKGGECIILSFRVKL